MPSDTVFQATTSPEINQPITRNHPRRSIRVFLRGKEHEWIISLT